MENFSYYAPTRYLFGHDVENRVGEMSAELLGKRVLVVIGGGSVCRSGLLDRVYASLDAAGVEHFELAGIQPNPTDVPVRQGIAIVRENQISGLLAVGGGSVIDTAKAIALGVPYAGDFWDFYAGRRTPETALPVGVVLTIPAAGSEGSGNSVITNVAEMKKISLRTDIVLRPRFALLNPELTFTLPPAQTAAGIADMIAHIFERYMSPSEDVEVTDKISEGLIMAIIEEAPKVMARPDDYQARANIMWAGTLAHNGVCGNGRVEDWSCHAIEHELSAMYGVTHGAGLAVIIPSWLQFMSEKSPRKPAQFARRVFGVNDENDRAAAMAGRSSLIEFFRSLGLPVAMNELGIENPDIPLLVERLHANKGAVFGGYYKLTPEDTSRIYELAM